MWEITPPGRRQCSKYIHELPGWPALHWQDYDLADALTRIKNTRQAFKTSWIRYAMTCRSKPR